jgi:hypothetical protein
MSHVTRRAFAGQVATAAAGALTVAPGLAADEKEKAAASPAERDRPESTVEDLQVALLRQMHPATHLTDENWKGIRDALKHNRSLADRLRRVPLSHDIPPAYHFEATRFFHPDP